jgi:hypothetical protein
MAQLESCDADDDILPVNGCIGPMNGTQVIYRLVEACIMLYCAVYFFQLGRAKTERMSEARKKLAEKLHFLGNPRVCFGFAAALFLFVICRVAELVHTLGGPF